MMIYFLKFTLASGLLWGVYHWGLELEKMHHFKRFYLLFSLFFAAVVPLIQLPIRSEGTVVKVMSEIEFDSIMAPLQETALAGTADSAWSVLSLLPLVYALISGMLLFRYIFGLYQLLHRNRPDSTHTHGGFRVVLLPGHEPAHSFLSTIFISKQDYEHPQLSPVILGHELAHLQQGHSVDLLLIELWYVCFWFNPFLLLYKRAIQLNHEFLADEAVLQKQDLETGTYQLLLLSKIAATQQAPLTHAFDYSITKKRLIMMTKIAKPHWLWFKKLAMLPLFIGMILAICDKTQAQSTGKGAPPKVLAQNTSKPEGVSQALMEEYNALIKRIQDTIQAQRARNTKWVNLSGLPSARLSAIYYNMSPAQRAGAPIVHKGMPYLPPAKQSPTPTQLQTWSGTDLYGIWIDGKKVNNSALKNYSPADFALFYESRLMKNAIPPGSPRRYQVNLYTHTGYQKAYIDPLKLNE